MIESVSRMSRTRSTPTVTCAIAFVVVARSFTGLKKRLEIGQMDGEGADRHRSSQNERGTAPKHDSCADRDDDRSPPAKAAPFTLRAFGAAATVA